MREFLSKYRRGFDFWSLVLYLLLILPYIVYWCLPEISSLGGGTVMIVSHIFGAVSAILLIFVVREEQEKKLLFDSVFTSISLLLLLYFASWIILFCGKMNFAVALFVTLAPCLALLLMAIERKNLFALLPVTVFFALQIVLLFEGNLF